jgi:hypothetical protein
MTDRVGTIDVPAGSKSAWQSLWWNLDENGKCPSVSGDTLLTGSRLCEYTRYSSIYRRLSVQRAMFYQCGNLLFQTSTLPLPRSDHLPPSRTHRSCSSPLVQSCTHHTATSRSQRRSSGTHHGPSGSRRGGNRGEYLIQDVESANQGTRYGAKPIPSSLQWPRRIMSQ